MTNEQLWELETTAKQARRVHDRIAVLETALGWRRTDEVISLLSKDDFFQDFEIRNMLRVGMQQRMDELKKEFDQAAA